MRPLIIDHRVKQMLNSLVIHAEKNKIPLTEIYEIRDEKKPPVGDRRGFSKPIPFGYRIVFSIEEHPDGWYRHMSLSVSPSDKSANPLAVQEIMTVLGFQTSLVDCQSDPDCTVYMENTTIVNVVELIK